MRILGVLLLMWGVGYAAVMNVTVVKLPTFPCAIFFAVGMLMIGLDLKRRR